MPDKYLRLLNGPRIEQLFCYLGHPLHPYLGHGVYRGNSRLFFVGQDVPSQPNRNLAQRTTKGTSNHLDIFFDSLIKEQNENK